VAYRQKKIEKRKSLALFYLSFKLVPMRITHKKSIPAMIPTAEFNF